MKTENVTPADLRFIPDQVLMRVLKRLTDMSKPNEAEAKAAWVQFFELDKAHSFLRSQAQSAHDFQTATRARLDSVRLRADYEGDLKMFERRLNALAVGLRKANLQKDIARSVNDVFRQGQPEVMYAEHQAAVRLAQSDLQDAFGRLLRQADEDVDLHAILFTVYPDVLIGTGAWGDRTRGLCGFIEACAERFGDQHSTLSACGRAAANLRRAIEQRATHETQQKKYRACVAELASLDPDIEATSEPDHVVQASIEKLKADIVQLKANRVVMESLFAEALRRADAIASAVESCSTQAAVFSSYSEAVAQLAQALCRVQTRFLTATAARLVLELNADQAPELMLSYRTADEERRKEPLHKLTSALTQTAAADLVNLLLSHWPLDACREQLKT